ncbi:MAG: tRNA lysidine(34) synthetase TilS [Clostridia bacterium]|nr:tRNA lysidine(34) synthetase TilS [Clostridia bacterium]
MNSKKSVYSLPKGFKAPHILSGLPENSPILVAYSGGADSGALLHMAVKYSAISGAKIYAAHVNHGIRGAEADRDENFCRMTAEKYGVELFVLRADVPAIAKKEQKSVETAARDVRYDYFAKLMLEHDIPTLCVAHNANDNLETIIFNIARGSGLCGVCGIPQTRDFEGGVIVRPILEMSKTDINRYCAENNIEYVTDSTNADTDYTRNRIRGLIIPELKKISPSPEDAATKLSENLRQDALCLDSMAKWFLDETRKGYSIETEKLNGSPAAISSRAVMALYGEISDGASLEYIHVKAVLELSKKAVPHSSLDLPKGVRAVIENGSLEFTKANPQKASAPQEFSAELFEGVNPISPINAEIVIEKTQKKKNIYKKSMNLFIDFDRIVGVIYARNRTAGDKIKMNSMSKNLKKLLCDKKIPLDIRSRLPVICDESGIIAVPLIGVKDGYAPSDDTRNTLCIEINLL